MQWPSSQIHIYPFLYVRPSSLTLACLASQSSIDHHSPRGDRKKKGRWSRSVGRGDKAGWLAEIVWNYHRTTSASWKYHQNLLSFRMHGWVLATALQPVARVLQFYLYSLHFCLKILLGGGKKKKNQGTDVHSLKTWCLWVTDGEAEMRSEYSAKEDSLTDESRRDDRVQTVEFGKMKLRS